jgi:hypothetical protein
LSIGLARASEFELSDEFETMQARAVLHADDELRLLNLGVTVHHHQAVLWGPAPSKGVSLRAEIRLRTMLPFADVRNELIVPDDLIDQRELTPGTPLFLPDIMASAQAP